MLLAKPRVSNILGKTKTFKNGIPKRMVIDRIEIFIKKKIGFNKFLTEI